MEFERTRDFQLIKQIATHARLYPASSDDFAPDPKEWEPVKSEQFWYVIAREAGKLLGMFVFVPENPICWRIHVLLLPAAYGPTSNRAGKAITRWIFENSPVLRLTGSIPTYNRLALRFARLSGWHEFGRNAKSYLKKGELHDQILFGISRSELTWD